ncbi:hypothetical protein ACIGAN_22520 [Streptomyces sp. NPDC085931]|uniref:hypothetical protein n=1 Tax=Streptomyces sp. NPDC085931 TaxID=3365740 RepID=UPI0037CF2CE6
MAGAETDRDRTQLVGTGPFLPLPEDASLDDRTARVDEMTRDHEERLLTDGRRAVATQGHTLKEPLR